MSLLLPFLTCFQSIGQLKATFIQIGPSIITEPRINNHLCRSQPGMKFEVLQRAKVMKEAYRFGVTIESLIE